MTPSSFPKQSRFTGTNASQVAPVAGRKLVANIGVFLIYIFIYWQPAFAQYFPSTVFLGGFACGTFVLALTIRRRMRRFDAAVLTVVSILLVLTTVKSGSFSFSNYLVAPLVAYFLVAADKGFFLKLLIFHLILSVAAQLYEFYSGYYLFVTIGRYGEGLDSTLFAGLAGIFRAKGMFQGPLSAVAYYIWMALYFRTNRIQLVSFMGALLAYGRFGILVIGAMTFWTFFATRSLRGKIFTSFILGLFLIVSLRSIYQALGGSFFLAVFELTSSGNLARFYYWETSFAHFLDYDFLSLLLGKLGYARSIIGSTENDFLGILLDGGLLTFTFYLFSLVTMGAKIRKRSGTLFNIDLLVIIAGMLAFPFIQSLNSAILFWVYYWRLFQTKQGEP